jgi:hypothetical protein
MTSLFFRLTQPVLMALSAILLSSGMPAPAQAGASAPPRSLQIVILDGEGALNNIQARTAREPIVQVEDENHKPVAGAAVLFAIHGGDNGAGAAFADGATQLSVTTGPDGKAAAHGLTMNQHAGAWQIAVTATEGTRTASSIIHETSYTPLPGSGQEAQEPGISVHGAHWWTSKPVLIAGGFVVAGVVISAVALQSSGRGATQISTGSTQVGAPAASSGVRLHFGR